MKYAALLMFACFGMVVMSIPAHALDRVEAMRVINNSEFLPFARIIDLPVGKSVDIVNMVRGVMAVDKRWGKELDVGYGCARKLGLMTFSGGKRDVFGKKMGSSYMISVTDKGKAVGKVTNKEVMAYRVSYGMPLYVKSAKKIIGIKKTSNSSALVKFELGPSEIFETGKCVYPNIDKSKHKISQAAEAELGLYDHGWMVESIKVKNMHGRWVAVEQEDKVSKSNGMDIPKNKKNTSEQGHAKAEQKLAAANQKDGELQSSVRSPSGSPPNKVIEKAVKNELRNNIPERWIGWTVKGHDAIFKIIEVKQWGKVKKINENKVYPLQLRVVGSATVAVPFGKPEVAKFDEIAEFRFFEDDFGNWKAVFNRPGLFSN